MGRHIRGSGIIQKEPAGSWSTVRTAQLENQLDSTQVSLLPGDTPPPLLSENRSPALSPWQLGSSAWSDWLLDRIISPVTDPVMGHGCHGSVKYANKQLPVSRLEGQDGSPA